MPSFSNIFNSIRGNNRVGVLPATTSPLAEATPIGSVIPQGVALTNRVAREISPAETVAEPLALAVAEREELTVEGERIPPRITQITYDHFINVLWDMVQEDMRVPRNMASPNFTRFRIAFESQDGRENLYDAFLNSPFAIVGGDSTYGLMDDDNTRLIFFYQKYRGRID